MWSDGMHEKDWMSWYLIEMFTIQKKMDEYSLLCSEETSTLSMTGSSVLQKSAYIFSM